LIPSPYFFFFFNSTSATLMDNPKGSSSPYPKSSPGGNPRIPGGVSVDAESGVVDHEQVVVAPATAEDKPSPDAAPASEEGDGSSLQEPSSNVRGCAHSSWLFLLFKRKNTLPQTLPVTSFPSLPQFDPLRALQIVNLALLPAKLRSILEQFDTDGDGSVSATELAAASKLWFKTHKADSDVR
jgi:hypothetical protein